MLVAPVTGELVERCAPLIPSLIRATGPISYDYQFGTRSGFFEDIMGGSWRAPGTLYAHSVTRVALCDGEPAGIEIGFAGPEFYPLRDAMAGVVMELVAAGGATPDEVLGLIERAEKASYLNAHVPSDVYYVHALSVPESHRGRGVGARLLEDAMIRAKSAGHRALQLDVLADNPAVRFYEAMGLRVLAEIRSPELERDHGFPSELRMGVVL